MHSIPLPFMSLESVTAHNLFYRGAASVDFVWNGRQWTLSWPGRTPVACWHATWHIMVGDFPVTCFGDGHLLADWAGSDVDAGTLALLPPPLLSALLEVRLEEIITLLESQMGKPIRMERLELAHASAPQDRHGAFFPEEAIPFTLRREDGQLLHGAVLAAPQILTVLAERVARQGGERPEARGERMAGLPLRLPLVLGELWLSIAMLRSLEEGDIVFPDMEEGSRVDAPRLRIALTPRRRAVGVWSNGTLCVEEMEMPLADVMPNSTVNEGSPHAPDARQLSFNPEDIPLCIQFELGAVTATVGELAALKPGHIFTTGRPMDRPVRFVVNGLVVGEGALLDVNGQIGVRVLSLAWPASAATAGEAVTEARS